MLLVYVTYLVFSAISRHILPGTPVALTLARPVVSPRKVHRSSAATCVPAETGRRTYVGDCLWSEPNCTQRAQIAQMVFDGELPPASARWLVEQLGARFVLADCDSRPDMNQVLAPLTASVHHFGCAAVYTLRAPSRA